MDYCIRHKPIKTLLITLRLIQIRIALFFTLLFSSIIITPGIICLVDDNQDITFFLDMNEEEENKGKESEKNLELKIDFSEEFSDYILSGIQKKRNIIFKSKNYTSEYSKITTPPPQLLV